MKKASLILIALLCISVQGAWAQTTCKYYECSWDEVNKQVVRTERTASGRVDDISTAKYASGGGLIGEDYDYFVATKSCTIRNGLTATGDCELILCDGVTVTIEPDGGSGGIKVASGNSLKIYAQSQGSNAGKLIVKVRSNAFLAGIGGYTHPDFVDAGTVEVHGGYVEAHGGKFSAGIGGTETQKACTRLTIYDGTVKAYGGEKSAGLGGGFEATGSGDISIYGGDVYAEGGKYGAGIGDGYNCRETSVGGELHVYGGKVTAKGGAYGAGIGGGQNSNGIDVTVDGGHVETDGGMDAAGIGSGEYYDKTSIHGGKLTVNGGYVYADGTGWGAGIGGGEDAKGAEVVINGGTVVAWAGSDAGEKNGSAIGSEDGDGRRGSLKIGDKMMVHAGQNPGDANGHLFSYGERVPACYFRPYCRVEVCNHEGHTYTINGTGADGTHTLRCSHCLLRTTEKHTFGADEKCTVCGVKTEVRTVSIYLPEKVGDTYTEGHYASTPRTMTLVTGSTFSLPAPPVTYIPNGVEFAGWAVGTPTSLGITEYWKNSGETVLAAGISYKVDSDVSFTARYQGVNISLADKSDNGETLHANNGKTAQTVTLTGRTLYKDGKWNTLCLPFDLTKDQIAAHAGFKGATLKSFSGSSFDHATGALTLNFTDAEAIEAGVPYLVKWSSGSNIVDPVFTGVVINSTPNPTTSDNIDFIGTFSPEVIYQGAETKEKEDGSVDDEEKDKTNLYMGADDKLYYPTTEGFKVNAFRAYFRLKDGLTAGELAAPVREIVLDLGEGSATGMSLTPVPSPKGEGSVYYSLDGRRVANPTKGVYIVNGKKVIIK